MNHILLIEDDAALCQTLKKVLEEEGYVVRACSSAEEALPEFRQQQYACIISDFRLPAMDGLGLLRELRAVHQLVPFIMITAYGSVDMAVSAMKQGATDFISKPFDPLVFCESVKNVIEHRRILDRSLGSKTKRKRSFLTKNPRVETLLRQAQKVAHVDSSVMLLGESGTGKELVARYIHEQSRRKDKPFVAVNCAAMPAELLESEFFGHEAGSFTGATQTRIGVLEFGSTGTVFLDEIGEMPAPLQVKLLRALQEKEIKRVGGNKNISINPRIISATNLELDEALHTGQLREDLYYRLAVVKFSLIPLRERREDILLLAEHYIEYFCGLNGKKRLALSAQAKALLLDYPFPGNARELENIIERSVILAQEEIRPEDLGINLGLDLWAFEDAIATLPEIALHASRQAEIEAISRTLQQTAGNKSRAAQILGVSYKTLLNKVKEYQLETLPRAQC